MNKAEPHFYKDTLHFLETLKENNNKEWFQSHQKEYEKYYKTPLRSILKEMSKRFAGLQLSLHAAPKLSLFRVNRDIRFSKNKDPYKTNIGIFFPFSIYPPDKKRIDKPGIYYHFAPEESFIAGGIHMPKGDVIKNIRSYISENWEELEEIISNDALRSEFSQILQGEKLKRMPSGYSEDHPKEEWLRLKDFIVFQPLDINIAFSNELLDTLEKKSIAASPFLEYFDNAINISDK
mgnify:CR=1 FL=1